MPVRMRLQRHGKKGMPFYHIVIADGRAPRDGKFIEKIGTYNPITKPAEIVLNIDKAVKWLNNGAQPSDTVRAILSYKGVLYKNHLLKGVAKGALTQEQADVKFNEWVESKEAKISGVKTALKIAGKDDIKKRLEAEVKANEAKATAIADKKAKELAAAQKAEAKAEETTTEDVVEETPATEEVAEEVTTTEVVAEETPATEETAENTAE
ncbi:MAG: 30S ribosomal protein S16 [Bacteroidetes bacterium]|nr:30S ribosomal protein S16 [Bacteroidota bacterium]